MNTYSCACTQECTVYSVTFHFIAAVTHNILSLLIYNTIIIFCLSDYHIVATCKHVKHNHDHVCSYMWLYFAAKMR